MKNYLKPTLVFAAASAGSPSTCLVQVDLELIADILGDDYDKDAIFGMTEGCQTPVPIDYYCKFTSVETGAEQGFLS